MCCNTKTYYTMSINSKSTHFYQLDGHILQQGPENPYLCVTISNDLKWSSHIKKTNSTLGFLKRNLKHCPLNCMMTAYISLIRSTLECSLVIWDTYFQKDIDKLEKFYARLPDSFQETTLQGLLVALLRCLQTYIYHLPRQKEGKLFGILLQGGRGAGAGSADP